MIPEDAASDTDAVAIRHYPRQFGMLSEGGMAVTVNQTQGTVGQTKLDVPLGTVVFQQFDADYFQLQSAAEWAELSALSSVASQASEAQQTYDTMHVEDSAEPAQTERSSGHTQVADLFQSFAEHNETKDAQPTAADLENKFSDSLLTPR